MSAGKEPEPKAPPDFYKALAGVPIAQDRWRGLTSIARRDFISWIVSAKQSETRKRRIEKACSMLEAGKRRPCCYSIVSLDLHLALKADPIAKVRWNQLTSIERRDFIAWMDSAKEPQIHRQRIGQACTMLVSGKRTPNLGVQTAAMKSVKQNRNGMKSRRFETVDEYMASLDPVKQKTLTSLIAFILSQFPELKSTMSWNVPQIQRNEKYVVGFAAFKHHLTFAPWSASVIERFKPRMANFVVKANCFQIPVDWDIDHKLVEDLVRARLSELDEQSAPLQARVVRTG